ncbi:MAG: hypothetical protein JWR80_2052 [Bradyrhizobium sp.]|nr:hypothetical protein [Bradyrhizobium sp.]
MIQLATIGYEGASLADFISTLEVAGVERVIDVRQVAQSRRPGFSKNAFRAALAEVGLDYHHIRQLGDPKHGREAARAGKFDLFRSIFNAHMELPASREALSEAVSLANDRASVLVCFERDPMHCHRTIVAERMAAVSFMKIMNLGVQPKGSLGGRRNAGATDRHVGAC